MFPIKIQVHREQAKFINALSHWYRGTRLNMHVTMHNTADQTFWIFDIKQEKNNQKKQQTIKVFKQPKTIKTC